MNFEDITDLQTRPTKTSDSRTRRFFDEFGDGTPSAELEAMHPDELRKRVRDVILSHIPEGLLDAKLTEEKAAREALDQIAERYTE